MWLQQQRPQDVLHTGRHVLLRYSSEAGIHAQSLSSCHVIQHSIKLGAVPNALLHLQSKDKTGSYKVFPRTPKKTPWIQASCSHLLNVPQDAVSIDKGVPGGHALIARQHLKRGGLACSVEAEKAETLSFRHGQRQPVHSQESLPAGVHLGGGDKRLCTVTWPHHTDTHREEKTKKEKTSHFFLTLLSCCRMSGLLTIDSNTGWHSRTLFLSSATSLSSGITAESWMTGNWDAPARENINSRNHGFSFLQDYWLT